MKTWQAWTRYGDPVGHGEVIASAETLSDLLSELQDMNKPEFVDLTKEDDDACIEIGYWELS